MDTKVIMNTAAGVLIALIVFGLLSWGTAKVTGMLSYDEEEEEPIEA